MAWQVTTVLDERRALIRAVSEGGESMTIAARSAGVSRPTAYKWLERWRREGEPGLEDRSRRPRTSPRRTDVEMEARVCELRQQHPAWGGRKLHHRLLALGTKGVPSPSAITDILRRNGLLTPDRRLKRDWQRFEAEQPNQIWQMDFKGDFALPPGRCYPLTVLDDHSRFNLCLQACVDQRTETVKSQLIPVFATHGLPEVILVDNGPPWGSAYMPQPHTQFTAWLISYGITVRHGRPYHPQTRGKDERFHRSLGLEVLRQREWLDLSHVQTAFDSWRHVYNQERPHEALAYNVPSTRYRPSARAFSSKPPEPQYHDGDEKRRVQAKGEIYFKGRVLRVGTAFTGQTVALRAAQEDGRWDVYFYQQRVSQVDLRSTHPQEDL
jgi:transposase InsO family protein